MNKIGVLGAGHLGKIHLNCIQQSPLFNLIGFYDTDDVVAREVEKRYGIPHFNSADELIEACDILDIVTPTVSHYECAVAALKKFRHVFIEKPITTTLTEARSLIDLANEANVKVQVGHVERFNPAFMAILPYLDNPMFVEAHRLAFFNPRGTDVPVVLDLMIHDIDIILSIIKSPVKKVHASGVAVVSDTPDIASARIEFNNGCVANLTANRISMKNMRKCRFFQSDRYISVDFLNKESEVIRMEDADQDTNPLAIIIDPGEGKKQKQILVHKPEIKQINAIKTELETFYESIHNNTITLVTPEDGYNSLDLAYRIMEKIKF